MKPILSALAWIWLIVLPGPAIAADPPLNVIVILADDLGGRDLGCYGSKYYRTPNIDGLAKDGVRFTDAYAACPVCSPTRASLITGKYPQRYGVTDWLPGRADRPDQRLLRPKLPEGLALEAVTLAEVLRGAGYVTASMGKWHLGGDAMSPDKQGFDVNIAGDHTGTPRSYFAPYRNKLGKIPGLDTAPEGEYLTDRLGEEAAKFIAANKAKPFFLYLPHYAVHTPLRAKKELEAKYKPGPAGTQGNPTYAAMVESLDDAVGRVLKELETQKLADRTLVIFTSDNGGLATLEGMKSAPTSNAPLREGKGYLYEGGVRVAMIVRRPGVAKPGVTSDMVVSSIDIFPTVLDLCGVKSDAKPDGISFAPVLAGKPAPTRDAIYWHYPTTRTREAGPAGRCGPETTNSSSSTSPVGGNSSTSRRISPSRGTSRRTSPTSFAIWRRNSTPGGRKSARRCRRPTPTTPRTRKPPTAP